MAITTRFISTSDTPFVPNPNKMDPGAASAAAKAQEGAASAISKSLNELAVSFDKSQEKVDDLYAANAKANLEVDYNKSFMEASGQIKPNGNFGMDSLKILQDMGKPYIDNAPNDATRQALIKSFIGFGKSAQVRGDTMQFNFNEKHDLQGLSDYATKSAALLAMGQVGEEKAYANLENIAAGLSEKGYDQDKIQKMVGGAKDQVWLQSRLTDATKNPFEVLRAAQGGAYADKGLQAQQHIVQAANNTIKANVNQTKQGIDKVLDSIYAGRPADDSVGAILNQAGVLAGQAKDPELTQKYAELALAQKWDNQTRNMTVPEMQQELLNVAKGVAVGGVSPEQAKKFEGVLKNRIDWANKDGFAFYQLQNPTANVGPLPTPNDPQEVIQAKVQSRAAAASAASELQGKPVAPVTAGELQAVFQNWSKLSFKQQEQQLNAFAAFGPEFTPAIAELAGSVVSDMKDKSAESLVPALNLMGLNPALSMEILKGSEKLNKKVVSLEMQDVKAQALLNDTFGSLYQDDPEKRSQYLSAAKAIAANQLAADPTADSETLVKQALADVSGVVSLKKHWYSWGRDYTIIPPEYGVNKDTMQNIIDNIKPNDLAAYSNGLPNIEDSKGNRVPLTEDDISDFQFVHVRGGQYKLVAGDSTVMNDKNQPLLFDMRSFYRDNKSTLMK